MIVVAIIGILSSIALPAYQTYVAKSILTSLHASASAGRTAMLNRYMQLGEMPEAGEGVNGVLKLNSVTAGLDKALKASPYQSAVSYARASPTTASFVVILDNINGKVNTKALTFKYQDIDGALSMKCTASPDLNKKYIPKSCQ